MKLITTLLIAFILSDTAFADSFVADKPLSLVARELQSQLPDHARDKLFQAKRGSAEWDYSFLIEIEKTWVTQVRINLKQINFNKTSVDVKVVTKEQGMIFRSTKKQNELTKLWADKIAEMLIDREEIYKAIAQSYIDATRVTAEYADIEALQKAHDEFLSSDKGHMLTSARIWNYNVDENNGLLLTYQNEKYPSLNIKIKRVTNELTVDEIDGHIIALYHDVQPDGELGTLNYYLVFKDEQLGSEYKYFHN